MKNINVKKIAVAFGHLVDAGLTKTARVAMLAYVGSKDGVTAHELAKVFNITRPTAYGALVGMQTRHLVRCEVSLQQGERNRTHVGRWFIEPYGKDVLTNFERAFSLS